MLCFSETSLLIADLFTFNCIYVNPIMLCCNNTKNLWCDYICNKNQEPWCKEVNILMSQMTVTISDVFSFPYKFISIKLTNIAIKVSVLSPNYVLIDSHFLLRCSKTYFFDKIIDLFPMIAIWMIFFIFSNG